MAQFYDHHIDANGFEAAYKDSPSFGAIEWHHHTETAPSGTAKVSDAWHWASDTHLGHGGNRKAVTANRLVEASNRGASVKVGKVTLADVLIAEQADLAALAAFEASAANREALAEFSGMAPADVVEAASFITSKASRKV